jgi:hypothetical protein
MPPQQTNNPMVYDVIRFGREVMQIPAGTRMELDSPQYKFVEKQANKFNELRMQAIASGPKAPPQYLSLTNQEGRSIDVLIKPNGEPQVIEPKIQNTTQGIVSMVNPTNAVPVVNPQSLEPYKGYVASGGGWGMGVQPTVGMNNDAARAAAAAQQGQAAPAAPQAQQPLTMTNSAGAAMTFSSPYQVREAFMKNQINHDEAKSALLHWGMK